MKLGTHNYQIVATEGYFSSGSSTITVSEGSTSGGGAAPVVTTSKAATPTSGTGTGTGGSVSEPFFPIFLLWVVLIDCSASLSMLSVADLGGLVLLAAHQVVLARSKVSGTHSAYDESHLSSPGGGIISTNIFCTYLSLPSKILYILIRNEHIFLHMQ